MTAEYINDVIETLRQASQDPTCRVIMQGALNALIASAYTICKDDLHRKDAPYLLGYVMPGLTLMVEVPYVSGNEDAGHAHLMNVAMVNTAVHFTQMWRNWQAARKISETEKVNP